MAAPVEQLSAHASARSDVTGNAEEKSNARTSVLTICEQECPPRELVMGNNRGALEAAARNGH